METGPLVTIIDDDESIRESLPDLVRELGFDPRTFSSAEDFLASPVLLHTKCLILDVAMPGMTGPELYKELKRRKIDIPVLFITAHESLCPQLRSLGAADCLVKPFTNAQLQQALRSIFGPH